MPSGHHGASGSGPLTSFCGRTIVSDDAGALSPHQRAQQEQSEASWYYPTPSEKAASIKDRVAFWRGVEIVP